MRLGINTLFMIPGDVGGTEIYLRETLVAALFEYPDVEFVLFTNIENDEYFKKLCAGSAQVICVCLNFKAVNRPARILMEQIKLPFVARTHNLDILWSPGYTAPYFAPCPQVVTVCDLQYKSYPEDMTFLERIVLDALVKMACFRCQAIIAISEFSRREILRFKFAPPEKVHSVLLGVDKSFGLSKSEVELQRELSGTFCLDKPFLLCVAHTYPHKKVHLLVEAFAEVIDDIPHNLVIVGKPRRGEGEVQKAMELITDTSRIARFSDGVPYKVLQALFQRSDMFILPSAYEGFGLPVVEAMMAGAPVVTTREASLPEVAGEHVFYMDSMDKESLVVQIKKILALSKVERTSATNDAKQWADAFTWEKSVQQMFSVFDSIAVMADKVTGKERVQ